MKKIITIMLALTIVVSLFTGCGSKLAINRAFPGGEGQGVDLSEAQQNSDTLLTNDEISYVLIYNPDIFDETRNYNENRNTGDIGEYVEAVVSRAEGIEKPLPEIIPFSTDSLNDDLNMSHINLDGNRAGVLITPYRVGDTKNFYYGATRRNLATFTCYYAGQYCNVWGFDGTLSQSQANSFGSEFDRNIYTSVTNKFGKSRFASNGGKVNLLFYSMPENGLGGYFWGRDLYATGEVSPAQISQYGVNLDHDIVNINTKYIGNEKYAFGTIAHEFQHLICYTNAFETRNGVTMRTWLNEAMSGYIEENLYPGTKDLAGHYDEFASSDRIRHGQSMYNFTTDTTNTNFDIGVYGSVYLFSEFLSNGAGDDVFSDIHSYWRTSYSLTLDEAEALANAVPSSFKTEVDNVVDYGNVIRFADADEEWMSKLTLKFYLSLLKPDNASPEAFEKVRAQTLLYDEINPADIEGGGRVVAALRDGEFKFPTDADRGLVYVGLNKNFEIVTEIVVR